MFDFFYRTSDVRFDLDGLIVIILFLYISPIYQLSKSFLINKERRCDSRITCRYSFHLKVGKIREIYWQIIVNCQWSNRYKQQRKMFSIISVSSLMGFINYSKKNGWSERKSKIDQKDSDPEGDKEETMTCVGCQH